MSAAINLVEPSLESTKVVTVKVPATGGELWQGHINDRLLMVNCPIDYFAEMQLTRTSVPGAVDIPREFELLSQAAKKMMPHLGINRRCEVEVVNAVPRGLGMASSTAELASFLYSLARIHYLKSEAAFKLIHKIITQLDSGNDGNYRQGINLVDPRSGEQVIHFPKIPAMKMLLINTGGFVATENMDREKERFIGKKHQLSIQSSFLKMIRGLQQSDARVIGQAATENTIMYQKILKKPKLEKLIALTESSGLLGICAGHSGTVLGLLAPNDFQFQFITNRIESIYGKSSIIGQHHIVSGGFYEI